MPIRFRCYFCMQLLAIAHRKAGTVITCPKCQGQVWVPDPNKPEETQPPDDYGEIDVELIEDQPAGPRVLLHLTPTRIRLLLVVLVVILMLLFGVGVWVGHPGERDVPKLIHRFACWSARNDESGFHSVTVASPYCGNVHA